jgi:hypothetical protein
MTLMFDNSRSEKNAFALVRAQARKKILFDARDPQFDVDPDLRAVCDPWLGKVAGPFKPRRAARKKKKTTTHLAEVPKTTPESNLMNTQSNDPARHRTPATGNSPGTAAVAAARCACASPRRRCCPWPATAPAASA